MPEWQPKPSMTAPASPRLAAAAQRAPAAAAAPPPGATAAAGFTLAAWLGPEMHALYGARFSEQGFDWPVTLATLKVRRVWSSRHHFAFKLRGNGADISCARTTSPRMWVF